MNLEKFDVITLADNKKYAITEFLEYDSRKYAFLVEVDAEGNPQEEMEAKVSEIIFDGTNTRVVEITDAEEQKQIKDIFENYFKNHEE